MVSGQTTNVSKKLVPYPPPHTLCMYRESYSDPVQGLTRNQHCRLTTWTAPQSSATPPRSLLLAPAKRSAGGTRGKIVKETGTEMRCCGHIWWARVVLVDSTSAMYEFSPRIWGEFVVPGGEPQDSRLRKQSVVYTRLQVWALFGIMTVGLT